jgi:hypothetical protein
VAVFDDPTKDRISDGGWRGRLFADTADKITGLTKSDGLTVFR